MVKINFMWQKNAFERVHNARHKNVTSALNTTFFKKVDVASFMTTDEQLQ